MYALNIENLHKNYRRHTHALRGIDLHIEQGDFFALLGPNGAGKSTMINILCSLVTKTQGVIKILGVDIDQDFATAKSHLGVVPQEFNFHPFEKVIDIIVNQAGYYGISRGLALQRAEKHLKALNLWDKRHRIARFLSGGMKRRLMIVRALIHQPKLLILDEPTAGVDIELRRGLWKFMRQINQQGVTIILTTHYLEEAESLCRNIAIINHGKIVEHNSMQRLLRKLEQQTFIVDSKDRLPSQVLIDNHVVRRIDDYKLEIDVAQQDNLNKLFAALSLQGIEIISMRNKSNRLEELFVRLTTDVEE